MLAQKALPTAAVFEHDRSDAGRSGKSRVAMSAYNVSFKPGGLAAKLPEQTDEMAQARETTMQQRTLGKSSLRVTPLAFGGNVFGWTVDEKTAFALLDRCVAGGLNLIDTADVYSRWVPGNQGGESEALIGRWLRHSGKRNQVVIATKVGLDMGGERTGLSAAHIERSVDESLVRLQTDCIDLYQAHRDDPATPLEETLEAFARLIKAGKVRCIGASNYSGARLEQALGVSERLGLPRFETLQPLYNLLDRAGYEEDLEPVILRHQVGVISYYGLARGFLTGKYRSSADFSKSPRGQLAGAYLNERGKRVLAALDEVAAEHQATPGQIALAWLMARPGMTAPIASASSLAQLDEMLGALSITLQASAVTRLNEASRP